MKWSVFLPIFYFCNNNISRWPHIAAFWRNHPGLAVLSTLISLCAVPHTGYAICLSPPGDVTGDGLTSVTDVQCNILANLWSLGGLVATPPACLNTVGSPAILPDHNCDGVINVSDTLMAVTFALYQPLSAELDNNGNQCVDACEIDTDADGDYDLSDCAPQNPTIHHGAVEICNGYDDNCNNDTDESGSSVTASCATTSACVTDGICGVQPTVTGLIITEIHHSPGVVEDSVGEWFEVYNAGTLPVNIQGFVLTDLNNEFHKVDAGGALFIPAKGYFVFGRNKNPANNGGVRVHYEYTGLGFSSISDTLAILDPSGTQLAKVTYSAAGGYPLVPGKSLALKSLPEPPLVAGSWAASSWSLDNGDWATPGGPNVDVIPSACEEGAPVVCDDQNPCTDDVCDDVAGCVNTFNTAPCAAVDPCVSTATCTQGVCVGGTSVSCDDSNPCTKDTCQAGVGCLHQATAGGCEDGDACTFLDVCLNGTCVAGIPTFCDDFNPCTVNSCVPTSGCVYSPTSGLCEDGNGCTELDICLNGICVAGIPKVCNDGNECTVDACHPVLGCVFTPTSGPCTDGNPCTAGDVCVSGKCIGGPAPVCNDFNVCTTDSCVTGVGCVYSPNTSPCDDGNVCTIVDLCAGGVCAGGVPSSCDDQNPCTQDGCHPLSGCSSVPVSGACTDNNACTQLDSCNNGGCIGGNPLICNDNNPCTTDSCHPINGCVFAPNSSLCNDSNPCTLGDTCSGGNCTPGGQSLVCDDGNLCTNDECIANVGCVYIPKPDGDPCGSDGDGYACSLDGCLDGSCLGVWLTPKPFTETAGVFHDILRVADGFVIVGYKTKAAGNKDVYIVKTDSAGELVWEKTVDNGATNEQGLKVKGLPDGGFVVAAEPADRLIRFTADGTIVSDTSSDPKATFWGVDVYPDGGVVAAGWTSNTFGTGDDMWIVKKNPSGTTLWEKKYNYGISDRAFDLVALPDGGALVVGYAIPTVSDVHGYVIRLNANGIKVWEKYYVTGTYSGFTTIEPAVDGGFILGGRRTLGSSNGMDGWLVRYDAALNELWSVNFGNKKSDDALTIMQAKDGGFVAGGQYQTTSPTGTVQQRLWVVKVNPSGGKLWEYIHNIVGGWVNGIAWISEEGGVAAVGWYFTPTPVLFFLDNDGTVCQ